MNIETYDVAIIGGGPAGLSAALVLGRARRRVVIIDAGAPRNAPAAHMHGFLSRDGTPVSLSFLGRLNGEADLLTVAHAWQRATDFHRKRPPLAAAAGATR